MTDFMFVLAISSPVFATSLPLAMASGLVSGGLLPLPSQPDSHPTTRRQGIVFRNIVREPRKRSLWVRERPERAKRPAPRAA